MATVTQCDMCGATRKMIKLKIKWPGALTNNKTAMNTFDLCDNCANDIREIIKKGV